MPVSSLEGLRMLAAGEPHEISAVLPYNLTLEGQDYPLGYVLRTSASARVADWPLVSAETSPDAEVEVVLVPGSDDTVTLKLLSSEELQASEAANADSDR